VVVETGQGGQVDFDVDQSSTSVGGVGSQEEVAGDVGSQLVVGASGAVFFVQRDHVGVDPASFRFGGGDGNVVQVEVCGAVDGGFVPQFSCLHRMLVTLPGLFGVGVDTESSDPGPELSGGR
jgi:hypothetical protein